jgi:hypothetical protein
MTYLIQQLRKNLRDNSRHKIKKQVGDRAFTIVQAQLNGHYFTGQPSWVISEVIPDPSRSAEAFRILMSVRRGTYNSLRRRLR